MSETIRFSNTCVVKMAKASKTVEAEVAEFEPEKYLNIILNKSVKLNMRWNGRLYEGKGAGIDFESSGPTISKTYTGRRG